MIENKYKKITFITLPEVFEVTLFATKRKRPLRPVPVLQIKCPLSIALRRLLLRSPLT